MREFIATWAMLTWEMIVSSALFLIFGFILAGIIRSIITPSALSSAFGQGRFSQIFRASLIGIPLPLCSCSVLPVAAQLHRSGLTRSGTASFLVSTPETGADSIALSVKLLGPVFAVMRPIAALITAIVSGLVVAVFMPGKNNRPELAAVPLADNPTGGLAARLREGQVYVVTDMFPELAYYLFWGFTLAGVAAALIPADILKGGLPVLWQYAAVVAISLPVYVCATSSTPLGAVLLTLGVSPGAVLAFLLIGPATNLTSLVVQKKILGLRGTVLMTLTIIVTALICGVIMDAIFDRNAISGLSLSTVATDEHEAWYDLAAGVIMASLLVYYTARHYFKKIKRKLMARSGP